MGESPKTWRQVLLGKLHRAVVTGGDLDAPDALVVDGALLEAAGFLEAEKVDLIDLSNGNRLALAVTGGARGSGAVVVNGAAGQLVRPGDLVSLAAYGWMKEKQALKHAPRLVTCDDDNRPSVVSAPAPKAPRTSKPATSAAKPTRPRGR